MLCKWMILKWWQYMTRWNGYIDADGNDLKN